MEVEMFLPIYLPPVPAVPKHVCWQHPDHGSHVLLRYEPPITPRVAEHGTVQPQFFARLMWAKMFKDLSMFVQFWVQNGGVGVRVRLRFPFPSRQCSIYPVYQDQKKSDSNFLLLNLKAAAVWWIELLLHMSKLNCKRTAEKCKPLLTVLSIQGLMNENEMNPHACNVDT